MVKRLEADADILAVHASLSLFWRGAGEFPPATDRLLFTL
jgi:hypothetical protein